MKIIKTLYVLVTPKGNLPGYALCEHCNCADNRQKVEETYSNGTSTIQQCTWRVLCALEHGAWLWTCTECGGYRSPITETKSEPVVTESWNVDGDVDVDKSLAEQMDDNLREIFG